MTDLASVKLSELAYRKFKERLLARDVRPGQFVSQRELVELTGATLAPMREALLRLEREGLVNVVPQRGIQVVEASLKLIRDALRLRMMIEKEAVRHLCDAGPLKAIEDLARRHEAIRRRMDETGIDAALLLEAEGLDRELHDTIVAALDNELVSEIHRVNADRIRLTRLDHGLLTPSNLPLAVTEHLAVLAACRRRDADAAAEALEAHLTTAMRRAMGV
jgi:DNA-binding GntR family transcriptional regulator